MHIIPFDKFGVAKNTFISIGIFVHELVESFANGFMFLNQMYFYFIETKFTFSHRCTIFFSWAELIQNTTYISVMPSTDSNLYAYPKVIFPVSMAQTRE